MATGLTFSRLTHVLHKNDVRAVFHSLKMRPVFLSSGLLKRVEDHIGSLDMSDVMDTELSGAIKALCDNRVLHDSRDRDDQVISAFRDSIGHPRIKIAYFILAESCNLGCAYCFENAPATELSDRRVMSHGTALKALTFYERLLSPVTQDDYERSIIFYGGEPLLNYPVLRTVLEEITRRREVAPHIWGRVNLSLVTNGTLLTAGMAAELRKYGVSVSISIDGPKEVTDANRRRCGGGSAFSAIESGMEACRSVNLGIGLSVTLSKEAVENYRAVMDYILEVKPVSMGFNIMMSNGKGVFSEEYDKVAAKFLIDAFRELRAAGVYEDRMMRKVRSFTDSQVYPFDCGATGGNQLVFSPEGRIGICHGYLQDKKFFSAHVDDDSFDPAMDPVFKEWSRRSPLNMEQCQSCSALGICGGGCPLNAERLSGSIWGLDTRFCEHAKATLEWLVWDLYEHATRSSPAIP